MQEGLAGWFGYPRILWRALLAVWVPAVGLLASEPAAHAPSGTAGFYVSFSRWRPGWVAVLCLAAVVVPLSDGVSPRWA